jgi:hypothetical protein
MADKQIDRFEVTFEVNNKSFTKDVNSMIDLLEKMKQSANEAAENLQQNATKQSKTTESEEKIFKKKTKTQKEHTDEIKKNADETEKYTKHVQNLNKAFEDFGQTFNTVSNFVSKGLRVAGAIAPFAVAYEMMSKASSFASNIAAQNLPLYYQGQQVGASAGELFGLNMAAKEQGLAQGTGTGILAAISKSQTDNKFFATSGLNNILSQLLVPIAKDGKARNTTDVMLDLASALQRNVKNKHMSKADVYNLLESNGFSADQASFLLQGRAQIKRELAREYSGNLSSKQMLEEKKLVEATGEMSNAFLKLKNTVAYDLTPTVIKYEQAMTRWFNFVNLAFKNPGKAIAIAKKDIHSGIQNDIAILDGKKLSPFQQLYLNDINRRHPGLIMSQIKAGESGGNYNAYNSGTINGRIIHSGSYPNLSNMTLGQVIQAGRMTQNLSPNDPERLHAAGAYQFEWQTLLGLVNKYHLDKSAKFNAAMQDKLAGLLIQQDIASGRPLSADWTSLRGRNIDTSALSTTQKVNNINVENVHIHANTSDGRSLGREFIKSMNFNVISQANSATR